MELAVAHVESDHSPRTALQENVGEAAGRRAEVERVEPGDVEGERVERVRELVARARYVRRRSRDLEWRVLVDLFAGLRVAGNAAGHDERLRLRTRLGETPLDEQDVNPLLGQRRAGSR